MKKFKFLEHTADVKFQAVGKTIEKVFENSSLALKETIYNKKVKEKIKKIIKVKGRDFENLLYNFLEEILYMLDAENLLISKVKRIKINKQEFRLEAEISGDDSSNYKFNNSVKAVTYNEMFVKKDKGVWKVQVVLDV